MDRASALKEAVAYLQRGDWQKAHELVDDDGSPLGCWAHGIVHLLEGDVANARYWFQHAQRAVPRASEVKDEIAALAEAATRAPAHEASQEASDEPS
jgi:Flp pilus assembly protein TadD